MFQTSVKQIHASDSTKSRKSDADFREVQTFKEKRVRTYLLQIIIFLV